MCARRAMDQTCNIRLANPERVPSSRIFAATLDGGRNCMLNRTIAPETDPGGRRPSPRPSTKHANPSSPARRALRPAAVAAACLALTACTSTDGAHSLQNGDEVRVSKIIKGDEVRVATASGKATVRLLGLHAFAPVLRDTSVIDVSKKAHAFVHDLLAGEQVSVRLGSPAKDAHGRYLGFLHQENKDLNARIVQAGHAIVYTEYPFSREKDYLQREAAARRQKRGIWANAEARALIEGLRAQWRTARVTRGRPPAPDPLTSTKNVVERTPTPRGTQQK